MFFLFFSYFGPEARNPRSSRRAGSQYYASTRSKRGGGGVDEHPVSVCRHTLRSLCRWPLRLRLAMDRHSSLL